VIVAVVVGAIFDNKHGASPRSSSTFTTSSVPASSVATTTTTVGRSTTSTAHRTTTADSPTSSTVATEHRLLTLTIAPQTHQGTYSRTADFGGWIDVSGCQNTRATLLIHESQAPVAFTSSRDCTVKSGRWVDPWSGIASDLASAFQIDHTVPLGNAWASGAWSWSHDQRVAYANDLADADHLVPIVAHENESKGDDGPDAWRPPSRSAWCRYAMSWDHIKAKWHLTATVAEWSALIDMMSTC
jgi:hypothetical protein